MISEFNTLAVTVRIQFKKIIEYDEDFISQDYKKRVVYDAYLADNFFETDWYNYYKGIHWYKNLFFKSAQKHGLAIPNK